MQQGRLFEMCEGPFTRECLIERSKSINNVIHRNNLKLFRNATKKSEQREAAADLTKI